MKSKQHCGFSCYLVGEEGLLLECAEFLLQEGHALLGFISASQQIKDWSKQHQINWIASLEELSSVIAIKPADYLFSFVNNKLIHFDILKHVRYLAINYHNAILPKYAGNHATSWAILNNEKQHGITWHVMNEVVDAGDILKQVTFPIAPDDTTISLDLKCLEKGLEAFRELVKGLAQGNYIPTEQNLNQRTYYSLHEKPPGNGLIDWSQSSEAIDRIYRALYFSHYTNKLALPKFTIQQDVFIIQELVVLNTLSTMPAGTIVRLSQKYLHIATATYDIALYQVARIEDEDWSINDLIRHYNLYVGYRLPLIGIDLKHCLEDISSSISPLESYWVNKLSEIKPINMPFDISELMFSRQTNTEFTEIKFQVAEDIKIHHDMDYKIALITLILIYLYRLNNYQIGTVDLYITPLKEPIKNLESFFNTRLPYTVELHPDSSFTDAMQQVLSQIKLNKEKQFYSRDIVMRYPILRNKVMKCPLAIDVVKDDDYKPCPNYLITFVITESSLNLSMIVSNQLMLSEERKAFIESIPQHIKTLFNAVISNPEQQIKNFPLLTAQEREKVLIHLNDTKACSLQDVTIHKLFEIQVEAAPDTIAVVHGNNFLNYASLNIKSNKLASYLRKLGAKDEDLIALCTNNSLELVIGILGVLKAGCAYVPIDNNYNKTFIRHIIEDSNTKIILTESSLYCSLEQCLPPDSKACLVLLDSDWDQIEKEKSDNINVGNSTDLAYVMYTSGSTGKPKGCLIEHKNLVNLFNDFQQKAPISSHDNATLWTSIGFDVSAYEIFSPLIAGATLYLFDKEEISVYPHQYFKKLQEYKITSAYIPPFMLNKFFAWIKMNNLTTLRRLLVGVEPIDEHLLVNIQNSVPNLKIINGYGPTEATICSTLYVIENKKIENRCITPIGKPVANTQIYILDSSLQPVPIGAIGELCIAGVGLARGYLNKPALTEKKFIPNPFSENETSRIYKTGDLACWESDGNIRYHGRLDDQVKVRGVRVELTAIESYLITHPLICQAFVITETDPYQHRYIAAYLKLTKKEKDFNVTIIRNYLSDYLPEYMVPSIFFVVDNFPLTPHGKIDKKALPTLTSKQQLMSSHYSPPTTAIQQQLMDIWQDFLQLDKIGVSDDFFDLGGHSLLVAEMFSRIFQLFNVHISLHNFLENPTIANLAQQLNDNSKDKFYQSSSSSGLLRDIELDDRIQPVSKIMLPVTPFNTILLTGVTGFLGAHLLHDLHRVTSATIYCLIRAKDNQSAQAKLDKALKLYQLPISVTDPRIKILVGNLEQEGVGLSELIFQQLAEEVDAIYHNGAWVNHLFSYDALKSSNVNSTITLLRLASIGKPKHFHYISTLSAGMPQSKSDSLLETFPAKEPDAYLLTNGYGQTKWVSELLLAEAHRRSFPVSIFRLGWIGGQKETGICTPENNHFWRFLKGCIQLGFAPNRTNQLDIVPVDIASQAIANISLTPKAIGQVFNLTNPSLIAWTKIIDWLNETKYHIELVPPAVWHQRYLPLIDKSNALYPLLPLYSNTTAVDWLSLYESSSKIDAHNTLSLLKSLQINYPVFSRQMFHTYLTYLQRSGFIAPSYPVAT
jgi:amino acid adenylation domain-containing protein/thioester reductase-like protein